MNFPETFKNEVKTGFWDKRHFKNTFSNFYGEKNTISTFQSTYDILNIFPKNFHSSKLQNRCPFPEGVFHADVAFFSRTGCS